MRVLAFTMVYNESENIERWSRYYKEQLGSDATLIVDNASDDDSVAHIRGERNILYPKMVFSNNLRATFVSSLAASMLHLYDVVIYTDSDEFLVANPQKYKNLMHYLEQNRNPVVTALGYDLVHMRSEEQEAPNDEPLLRYHRYLKPTRSMCKTLITRVPVKWGGGFHTSDRKPFFDPDLWLFHTKSANFGQRLRRQAITRTVVRDDESGAHQRWSDEKLEQNFQSFERLAKQPFDEASRKSLIDIVQRGVERGYIEAVDLIKYRLLEAEPLGNFVAKLPDDFPKLF